MCSEGLSERTGMNVPTPTCSVMWSVSMPRAWRRLKIPGVKWSPAVAAPTAGLHFTPGIFNRLHARGIETLHITLHVGVGTFIPVRSDNPSEHILKPELYT